MKAGILTEQPDVSLRRQHSQGVAEGGRMETFMKKGCAAVKVKRFYQTCEVELAVLAVTDMHPVIECWSIADTSLFA